MDIPNLFEVNPVEETKTGSDAFFFPSLEQASPACVPPPPKRPQRDLSVSDKKSVPNRVLEASFYPARLNTVSGAPGRHGSTGDVSGARDRA
jgi:hypothetical protein